MLNKLDRFLKVTLYLFTVTLRLFNILGTLGFGVYITMNLFQTHQISFNNLSYFLLCLFIVSLSELLLKK